MPGASRSECLQTLIRPNTWRRTISSVAMLGLPIWAVQAVEQVERTTVRVGGMAVEPMTHLSAGDGTWRFHPKGMLRAGYDDNVFQSEDDAVSDTFQVVEGGVDVRWQPSRFSLLELELVLGYKNYTEEDTKDQGLSRIDLQYSRETENWLHDFIAAYARSDDVEIETGRSIDRSDARLSYEAVRNGYLNAQSIKLDYLRTDYLEDGRNFTKEDRNRHVVGATGSYTKELAAEKYLRYELRFFGTFYDRTLGEFQDSLGARGSVTYRTVVDEVHRFSLTGGVEYRVFDDYFDSDPAYDDQRALQPIGELTYDWRAGQQTNIFAKTGYAIREGFSSNWLRVFTVTGGLRYDFLNDFDLALSGGWQHRLNSGAPESEEVTRNDLFYGNAAVTYYFRKGMALRLAAELRKQDSSLNDEYQRGIVHVDLAVAF